MEQNVKEAIECAEEEVKHMDQIPQQEEYESLVLGSSIWSTDV